MYLQARTHRVQDEIWFPGNDEIRSREFSVVYSIHILSIDREKSFPSQFLSALVLVSLCMCVARWQWIVNMTAPEQPRRLNLNLDLDYFKTPAGQLRVAQGVSRSYYLCLLFFSKTWDNFGNNTFIVEEPGVTLEYVSETVLKYVLTDYYVRLLACWIAVYSACRRHQCRISMLF